MSSNAKEIMRTFTAIVERIANGKVGVLHTESNGVGFYRREIHIIKVIGDSPGINNAEIARHFGITRAVVHKTLLKLEEKGCVDKRPNPENVSKHMLFLTPKGEEAYQAHEKYHKRYDSQMYCFLQSLNQEQLKAVQTYLNYAKTMVEHMDDHQF